MPSAAKAKGNRFEREIAHYFTNLFGVGEFLRTPTSGAFTGGKNKIRTAKMSAGQVKSFRGDIVAPDGIEFVIECKNHKDFPSFHTIITGHNKKLNGWLNEVYFDSDEGNIPHCLAFKITGTASVFFALPVYHFGKINIEFDRAYFYMLVDETDEDFFEYIIIEKAVFDEIYKDILKVIKR